MRRVSGQISAPPIRKSRGKSAPDPQNFADRNAEFAAPERRWKRAAAAAVPRAGAVPEPRGARMRRSRGGRFEGRAGARSGRVLRADGRGGERGGHEPVPGAFSGLRVVRQADFRGPEEGGDLERFGACGERFGRFAAFAASGFLHQRARGGQRGGGALQGVDLPC